MSDEAERLARLAAAQRGLAELLEARLAREESRARGLRSLVEQLSASMSAMDARHLVFHAAGFRRLADADAALAASRADADRIRRELLAARGREKALSSRAALFRSRKVRKAGESEALEVSLNMSAKASRKTGVLK